MTLRSVIGSLIGLALIALLLRQVDLRELGQALLAAQPMLVAISMLLQLAVMWLKSVRLALVTRRATGREAKCVFSACMVGFAGNLVLPARLGELLRIEVIARRNQTERPLVLTAVALTQLFDTLALASCFLAVSFWAGSFFAGQKAAIGLLAAASLAILIGLFILQRKSHWLGAKFSSVQQRLPGVLHRLVSDYTALFIRGLSVLGSRRSALLALLLTAAVWALETAAAFVMLRAFHIIIHPFAAAVMVVVLSLGFAFPLTPGNMGISQALTVFVLGAFDVPPVAALAYSIGAQGIATLLVVGLGFGCLCRVGITLSSLREMQDTTPSPSAPASAP